MNKRIFRQNKGPQKRPLGIGECPAKRTSSGFKFIPNYFPFASFPVSPIRCEFHRSCPAGLSKVDIELLANMGQHRVLTAGLNGTCWEWAPSVPAWVYQQGKGGSCLFNKYGRKRMNTDEDRQRYDEEVTAELNWQEWLAQDIEHDKWLSEIEADNKAFQMLEERHES